MLKGKQMNQQVEACRPNKEELKNRIKIAKKNLKLLVNLLDNGVLHYDKGHEDIGRLFMQIQYIKRELDIHYPKKQKEK